MNSAVMTNPERGPGRTVWSKISALAIVLLLYGSTNTWAQNWPQWRGLRGDGSSPETNIPTQWDGSTGQNIVWKTPIPGEGHSSPIVWEDRIFLTSCLTEQQQRILLCLDKTSGHPRWQQTVLTAPLESKHSLNSFASGTPATDGQQIFVTFLEPDGRIVPAPNVGSEREITAGRMVVAAYDFNGQRAWLVRPGEFISAHGYCSCPVLFEDKVIINGDHDGDSYLLALDKRTGQTVWKVKRKHGIRSYVTPLLRTIDGRSQLILSGSQHIASYNPVDGSLHWEIDGPTEQFVASLVYDGKLLFMTCGYPDYHVMGIDPTGQGNVTASHIKWHVTNARCYVPSPVVLDGFLLVADDRGTGNCFDAATGERYWQARLGNGFSGSLVTANGLSYWTANNGETNVIRPGQELDLVATNPLGENCYSSPAISDGHLLIRGESHLFCIGMSSSK